MKPEISSQGAENAAGGDPTVYQAVLATYAGPAHPLWAFNVVNGLVFAAVGHPWLALALTLAQILADARIQPMFDRWLAASDGVDCERGLDRLSWWVFGRATLALSAPTVVTILGGRPQDLIYLLLLTCGLLLLGAMRSLFSARLFLRLATPPVLAMAAGLTTLIHKPADLVIFGGLGWLGGVLAVIAVGAERAKQDLQDRQVEKNLLIAHLTEARDEAVRQRVAADAAGEAARRANMAKSTFLANISHEIRTPMNGVMGMAQMLRRSRLTPIQRGHVDTLARSGELLMTMLGDVLDIAQIDGGGLEIALSACDLGHLVSETQASWSTDALEKSLAFSVTLDAALPTRVSLDGRRVRQILSHLLSNALKFTDQGQIGVTVTGHGDRLVFEVADTGCGIAPEDLPNLFERFTQADESSIRRFSGVGLGLALCRQLARLMGGDVTAESQPGQGSRFRLDLPLTAAEADLAPPPVRTEILPPEPRDDEGPALSVLAADDNPTNLLVLEHLLGALGYRIYKAGGGKEALEALTTQTFDLVLMDIQMPEMTGIDVLQTLRGQPGPNRETPLIAVTADAMTYGRERYLDLGFAGYVTKPVQVTNLVAAMMSAVANPELDEDDADLAVGT